MYVDVTDSLSQIFLLMDLQLLKPTVSIAVLEEKTALFVKGKTDAKTYYGVLKAAFGDKLGSVLPQIIANLPDSKAAELSKVA